MTRMLVLMISVILPKDVPSLTEHAMIMTRVPSTVATPPLVALSNRRTVTTRMPAQLIFVTRPKGAITPILLAMIMMSVLSIHVTRLLGALTRRKIAMIGMPVLLILVTQLMDASTPI
jgi:hypothetical protein